MKGKRAKWLKRLCSRFNRPDLYTIFKKGWTRKDPKTMKVINFMAAQEEKWQQRKQ